LTVVTDTGGEDPEAALAGELAASVAPEAALTGASAVLEQPCKGQTGQRGKAAGSNNESA
jgi:hypothetical protein